MLRTHLLECFYCGEGIVGKPFGTTSEILIGEVFCSEECLLGALQGIDAQLLRIEIKNLKRAERPRDPINARNYRLWSKIVQIKKQHDGGIISCKKK